MGRIKGITVTLTGKTKTGRDDFGHPIYENTEIQVENVLVVPSSTEDITNQLNLTGKKAAYTLGIPKGDQNEWKDREVRFFRKVSDGGLHAHDILGSCCLSGDDVHRPDVDVGHGRRKEDVYGLVEPHFDTAGCYIDVLRICGEGRKQRCDRKEKTG